MLGENSWGLQTKNGTKKSVLKKYKHNIIKQQRQGGKKIDFDLTREQEDIRNAAREFAEGEFPDIAKECDRNEKYPDALVKKAADLGFIGACLSRCSLRFFSTHK